MDLEMAKEICKKYGGHAYINIAINNNGEIERTYIGFWNINKEQILDAVKKFNLSILKKELVSGDIDLKSDNFKFNKFSECKIVGYKTKYVPAHTEQTPIYEYEEK